MLERNLDNPTRRTGAISQQSLNENSKAPRNRAARASNPF